MMHRMMKEMVKRGTKAVASLPKRAVNRMIRVHSDPNVKGGLAEMMGRFRAQRKTFK